MLRIAIEYLTIPCTGTYFVMECHVSSNFVVHANGIIVHHHKKIQQLLLYRIKPLEIPVLDLQEKQCTRSSTNQLRNILHALQG